MGMMPAFAQAQRARSIEFSEPSSDVSTTTNLSESVTRKSGRTLNPQVKKPYDIFNNSDSMPYGTIPPPQTVQPSLKSKRVREAIQKKREMERDWVFMTPEELNGENGNPEDMLNLDEYDEDGLPKSKKTRLEKYYERMQAGNTNQVDKARNPDGKGEISDAAPNAVEAERRSIFASSPNPEPQKNQVRSEGEESAWPKIEKKSTLPESTQKQFADFFGFSSSQPSLEKSAGYETRMQDFKSKIIEVRPVSSFTPPSALATPSAPALSSGVLGGGGALNPSPTPAVVPSFKPPGFSSYATTPAQAGIPPAFTPPPEPSFRLPTGPVFEPPKRKF